MEFKDSRTYKNLQNAYNGERITSTKYRIYADKAREDGYQGIADTYDETAHNEKEHAEVWLKQLNGGKIPDTYQNLEDSYMGEHQEWTSMYPEYAQIAEEEGYGEIARLFREISQIEKQHDIKFEKYAEQLPDNKVFCDKWTVVWVCLNCGEIYYGTCAPKRCPFCGYPQGYFVRGTES